MITPGSAKPAAWDWDLQSSGSCIESCGGTVRCRNRVPKGLEIEIMLRAVQA
jgi:hypothetical protein